jgi:hypothetical protein
MSETDNKDSIAEYDVEVEDPFVIVDCCNYIINMDKQGYYVLERGEKEELIWCQDCFYSDLWHEMKKKGWTCDDDDDEDSENSDSDLEVILDYNNN